MTSNYTLGFTANRNEISVLQKRGTRMVIVPLLVLALNRKQSKCPSAVKWKYKLWHMYIMRYYITVKKDKPPLDMAWVILTDIILTKRSQTQKVILVIETQGRAKSIDGDSIWNRSSL